MKRILLITAMLIYALTINAQQKLPLSMSHDPDKYPYTPLLVIRMPGKELKTKNLDIMTKINPDKFEHVSIFKDNTTGISYGEAASHGLVIIDLRSDMNIDVTDTSSVILAFTKLNGKTLKGINLPVYVDSLYVEYPEDVYLKKAQIRSITENTEKASGIKFINVTTYPKIKPRPISSDTSKSKSSNTIYIRGKN